MWAYIDAAGAVHEYDRLPASWNNISNFYAMEQDPAALRELGWYPLVDETVPLTSDLYQYHGPVEYRVDGGTVIKNAQVLDKDNPPSADEIFEASRQSLMMGIRMRRDELLKECDWTQAVDLQNMKGEEWKIAWMTYRQSLRDMPERYSAPPYDTVVDYNQVAWPERPQG